MNESIADLIIKRELLFKVLDEVKPKTVIAPLIILFEINIIEAKIKLLIDLPRN